LAAQVKVKLVGVSEAGFKGELYDVLTEFFNDSSCWTQCATINAVPGTTIYPVTVTEGQIIRLNGVTALDVQPSSSLPTSPAPQGTYRFIPALMGEIGLIQLKHSPNTAETYYVDLVTNVSLPTAREMMPIAPDWVLPIWHVGILDGVLGKMMSDPNKSYTSATQAVYHLKRFRDAIARARVSKLRANTIGSAAWRFPQQFRMTSQQGGVPAVGSASERSF
jgi:hypothetical protein